MLTCAVLVLNYNGRYLLEKNLPSVLKAASKASCETVVVDNGSEDGSTIFVTETFPRVKVIGFRNNHGYGEGNNLAAKKVDHDIIILLNNDVIPEPDAFKRLMLDFRNQAVFAVSCRQLVKTPKGAFIGGVAIGEFSRGLLRHHPHDVTDKELVPQLYASGGAAAFDRKKFLSLGGFDRLYAPFYWEDADLSARAWARGWKVLYDPRSVVEHRHESTIKRVFPHWYIKAIGDRNMLIFTWRHLNGWENWLSHFVWLPIHIVRRPLAFIMALPKILAVIARRWSSPYHIEIDKLVRKN